ncbi:MAG TPA: tRNA preQ1(34) S-adenosylmethionine ribosyltransferase-isomerase QueA [Hungateiclostridium thermocellum]|jgi:S-adenosylmethionine:tRNA ribosyltransferase-isomerase|uniref:S-adenosylmethionine:tRNA ribosyltransferase-isomerase n=2 Tax=Acetivibrio thermocellus TaxID=1515 RepID=QUEA_ACET2|nr:tRNA preQ1(34) S-adenosylmethionine ribosyltransferase-isomerase QueA [Acetivibrio thermocellus]A3DE14.1 RecName: Full=S-adenosylmethionine:tRNA ribosyltransferase-isomerase; AltName: Full=Queuosine biosynthesis protein QueA [Acetivibrio thermocellus ATCC 27405]CDG35653.1 S-adenosylmethionine:tRNA ribosyltransferase-isomerase [Acetivibrio thermocellus BC1]ABN52193.1 S-adenosylmethionine/tRNA-ribosyltransferase-isomerase [Acetivibrio thermocellus ATCC 27405]ADU74320.1 S-adenosylmethionine/tRN
MKVSDFYYDLPQELIAQEPVEKRDMSRLMVLDKETGKISHKRFKDIVEYINKGDCLVLNDTRVIPARLLGEKEGTGGKIEFVLLKRINGDVWEVILKPGKKAKPGARFVFGNGELKAEVIEIVEEGNRLVRFEYDGIFEEILDRIGIVPLPPYITKKLDDAERYQTVYSRYKGSAAAPTAGLHFTLELLEELAGRGVKIAYVTLHVGLGTFRPVKVENLEEHKMHSEFYRIKEEDCDKINSTKQNGGKIIAVGTTSCRVLETVGDENGIVRPQSGWTDIFIYPGYKFKVVDSLITNFHLPESTLIMLVSALAGREKILEAYNIAVKERYRFFSFGDAMFIK